MRPKTPQQISAMRVAGQHLSAVFAAVEPLIQAGLTTEQLDDAIKREILRFGDRPAFLNYEGFPKSSCISVNEEVIHAIPGDRALQEGDIVTIDVGLWHDRVCVDAARTWAVGQVDAESQRLITVTAQALAAGVAAIRPGARVGEISAAIQAIADQAKLGIVRHYTGHGVGLALHEEPSIPNYGRTGDGPVLKEGLTICLEPMLTLGGDEVSTLPDGWTVVTVDGSRAAQIEHTILITATGAEILV
jgi:methionyl aminopeptidase